MHCFVIFMLAYVDVSYRLFDLELVRPFALYSIALSYICFLAYPHREEIQGVIDSVRSLLIPPQRFW